MHHHPRLLASKGREPSRTLETGFGTDPPAGTRKASLLMNRSSRRAENETGQQGTTKRPCCLLRSTVLRSRFESANGPTTLTHDRIGSGSKDSPVNGTFTSVEAAMSDRPGERDAFLGFLSPDQRSINCSKPPLAGSLLTIGAALPRVRLAR